MTLVFLVCRECSIHCSWDMPGDKGLPAEVKEKYKNLRDEL